MENFRIVYENQFLKKSKQDNMWQTYVADICPILVYEMLPTIFKQHVY